MCRHYIAGLCTPDHERRRSDLDLWIEEEEKSAVLSLLANVAPGGHKVPDAAPGSVIASPSKVHPNYYYQWVRDAAITVATIIHLYDDDPAGDEAGQMLEILDAYNKISHTIQHVDNPSGSFEDKLSGLGEPKFHVDGTAFTGNWGRPQRDGPALRALSLMLYMKVYNETHPISWSEGDGSWFDDLYDPDMPANSTIKADLEYVSHHWRESGFDLWEEVQGLHFFTAMVQLKALREGAKLATLFEDHGAAKWYQAQADEMTDFMPTFWNQDKGHLEETLNSGRSGLDCGLLLGAIHGTTVNSSDIFAPYSDEVLVSLLALVRDQRDRFPINSAPSPSDDEDDNVDLAELSGVGVGRYPEDVYDGYGTKPAGGNPWFLCTSSVAEILFRTAEQLSFRRSLLVTDRGLPFWSVLLPSHKLRVGKTYDVGSSVFDEAVERLKLAGDSFLTVVKDHTDAEGSLSEQFDRVNGFERGATDLTWSYGAFIQAVRARRRVM
ncbi:glycoside hydrolase family 15 protein [Aulographum hederae CBS 113979]|uniref:glucan 1,4-alpha-glucosidase n=1 Tax=Aulographum hederae CBS 113979 TaxID=1176131 RepID=A0A6G1H7H6_9PEZI|nr:glycoside hydrolase family 15 protein [Aulographum hederae CBS 113979]